MLLKENVILRMVQGRRGGFPLQVKGEDQNTLPWTLLKLCGASRVRLYCVRMIRTPPLYLGRHHEAAGWPDTWPTRWRTTHYRPSPPLPYTFDIMEDLGLEPPTTDPPPYLRHLHPRRQEAMSSPWVQEIRKERNQYCKGQGNYPGMRHAVYSALHFQILSWPTFCCKDWTCRDATDTTRHSFGWVFFYPAKSRNVSLSGPRLCGTTWTTTRREGMYCRNYTTRRRADGVRRRREFWGKKSTSLHTRKCLHARHARGLLIDNCRIGARQDKYRRLIRKLLYITITSHHFLQENKL